MEPIQKSPIRLSRTQGEKPAVWERGGGYSNTGTAQVVCGSRGERLPATYIRTKGSLACSEHALVRVKEDDYVLHATHHREDFTIRVVRIVGLEGDGLFEDVATFNEGEWHPVIPDVVEEAVRAVKAKATCYHCREPHYILTIGECGDGVRDVSEGSL